jgi:hypothetical protein
MRSNFKINIAAQFITYENGVIFKISFIIQFTKAWSSGNNEDRKNVRLKVNFQYDDKPNIRKNENILSDNAEILKNKLSRIEASIPTSPTNDAIKNDAILSELLALRKKYDSVVEYTVHLTSERDTIISQMEELQKELNRERQKKKGDNVKGATIQDAGTNKKQNRVILLVSILSDDICDNGTIVI